MYTLKALEAQNAESHHVEESQVLEWSMCNYYFCLLFTGTRSALTLSNGGR
jgi:hypothetical protein